MHQERMTIDERAREVVLNWNEFPAEFDRSLSRLETIGNGSRVLSVRVGDFDVTRPEDPRLMETYMDDEIIDATRMPAKQKYFRMLNPVSMFERRELYDAEGHLIARKLVGEEQIRTEEALHQSARLQAATIMKQRGLVRRLTAGELETSSL